MKVPPPRYCHWGTWESVEQEPQSQLGPAISEHEVPFRDTAIPPQRREMIGNPLNFGVPKGDSEENKSAERSGSQEGGEKFVSEGGT